VLIGDFDPPSLGVENKLIENGYEEIKKRTGLEEWSFFSDVPREVGASQKAGMKGYVVSREGNKPLTDEEIEDYTVLKTGFEDILELVAR